MTPDPTRNPSNPAFDPMPNPTFVSIPTPTFVSIPTPTFVSMAFDDIPEPDYADVIVVPWRGAPDPDPADVAALIFSISATPLWVKGLMGLRQAVVGLIGVKPAQKGIFAVREVRGCEALVAADDRHLDFRAGVAVENGLLRMTTAVRLKGWRGRLYFVPVRVLHPIVVSSMMRKAVTRARGSANRASG